MDDVGQLVQAHPLRFERDLGIALSRYGSIPYPALANDHRSQVDALKH
jgi:hypothetical protein